MHIAIAGNIGSGKTTLTKMLAAHYGWTPKFESVDYNPYLADFYEDMERWSFNLQVYFLNKRGAEGEIEHTEGGTSRTFETADIPVHLRCRITPVTGGF